MRKTGRVLLLILILILCSVLGLVQSAKLTLPNWQAGKLDSQKMALIKDAKAGRAYLLPPSAQDKWLQFPLLAERQSGRAEVRIVSTASVRNIDEIRRQHLQDPGKRWDYALLLEFLDARGQVLARQTWHQSANLQELKRLDGTVVGAAFYLEPGLNPLSSEVTTVNVAQMKDVAAMRVKLHSSVAEVADVALRVYQPRPLSEQDLAHHWARLSPQQQEELARGSVHDKALLQEHEKQNLLRNSRQAIGPLGHEGQDYEVRDIYVLMENEGLPQDAPIAPYGVLFDRSSWATLPIPPQGGQLRLELVPGPQADATVTPTTTPANATAAAPIASSATAPAMTPISDDGQIHLRWHGPSLFERSASSIAWQGKAMQHRMAVKGGLLELDAPRQLALRAFLSSNGKEQEITPLPQYERVFIATHDAPISWALANSSQLSGLRLSVRSLLPALAAIQANYEAFDSSGKSLARGQLPVAAKIAHYESLMQDYASLNQGKQLSEVTQGFFVLPPKTARFKVWADSNAAPLLVLAHTRPYALAREVRVPDDFFSFDAQGQRIPGWFLLPPQDEAALLTNDRSRLLLLQSKPLAENEEQAKILSGNYQWQDYRPHGNWLARPIFTPREADIPFRDDALPTTFTPLATGKLQALDLPVFMGSNVITTSLLWLGPKQAAELDIRLDGKPFFTVQAHGPYGEYELPAIPAGRHQIQVNASVAGQVLINHVRPNPASLVKRVGQRFNGELVFDYERTSAVAETLTARLYQPTPQPAGQEASGQFSVRIEGPPLPLLKPLSAWVFAERVASVRAGGSAGGRVFDTEGGQSDAGNPVFIPFPFDAPLGRYRITLRSAAGVRSGQGAGQAYVSFSRLSPALLPQRRAQQLQELQSVQIIE
jgi:hypothetical protein